MKKAILYIIFIFSIQSYCQNSGRISYVGSMELSKLNKSYNSGKYDTLPAGSLDAIKKILDSNQSVEFLLNFNNQESVFNQVKKLDEQEGKLNLSAIIGGKGIIYENLNQNIVLNQTEAFGELFLVESKIDSVKWKLTKETKTINNFICYKATTINIVKDNTGIQEQEVVAWYTPNIPKNFGPAGYCNLPGLILELKVGMYLYRAVKVDLKINAIEITKPKKGKKVTIEEFNDIGLHMNDRLMGN